MSPRAVQEIPGAKVVARVVEGEGVHVHVCPACGEEIAADFELRDRAKKNRKPWDAEKPLFDGLVDDAGYRAHYLKEH